jgi:rRNA biogenesis protein RRP5
VDLTRRRILLTAKKTLLNSNLQPLTFYSPTIQGHSFHGTIVSLTPHGAVVEFYAGVRGYLPVNEMSEAYITDATQHFRLGQTVKTWVLSVDQAENRMRLSLKDQLYWSQGGQTAFENLEEGSIVSGTVTAKLEDKIVIDILANGVTLRGVVNLEHLADTPGSKCEKKLAKIREGSKLKEVLVLSKSFQNRNVTCSIKPTLIELASEGNLPTKYEDLYRGKRVTGWVKNVEDFGGFIAFAGSAEGVVYKKVMVSYTWI